MSKRLYKFRVKKVVDGEWKEEIIPLSCQSNKLIQLYRALANRCLGNDFYYAPKKGRYLNKESEEVALV